MLNLISLSCNRVAALRKRVGRILWSFSWVPAKWSLRLDRCNISSDTGFISHCCGEKAEQSLEAKLLISWLIYVQAFSYARELCVVFKTRLPIYTANMSLLHRVSGLTLRDRMTERAWFGLADPSNWKKVARQGLSLESSLIIMMLCETLIKLWMPDFCF